MPKIFYAALSRADAETAYAARLLARPPVFCAASSAGNLYLSPPLPRPQQAAAPKISEIPVTTTEDETVTRAAVRNFSAGRRLPGRLVCAQDPAGFLVCDKDTWDALIRDLTWAPLNFPDILTDVLTEKEAADLLQMSEKDLKKQRETGAIPKHIFKPSGKTALYLKSALAKTQSVSESETLEDAASRPESEEIAAGNIRNLLPLLLVFTPPEAAVLWHRPSEEIRSAAAGAGHRAARLSAEETRTAGRQHLVTYDALTSLFGPPDPTEWAHFISQF